MDPDKLFQRYEDLQRYVGWTADDARRVTSVAAALDPHLPALVEDFYAEVDRHPAARRVITGGPAQVERLKGTLLTWLRELLRGPYDRDYAARRWRVGWRHVEIGLDQVFTNVALSRLRRGLLVALDQVAAAGVPAGMDVRRSLNTLLDLDLAIIEDAYQAEHLARQQRAERLATIGQVAGGIAHELRNPLNVVKTSVYYLLNARNPTPAKTAEHLARIERHVTLADGVITALANFAKQPVPTLVPVPVDRCVRDALEYSPPPQAVRAELRVPEGLPPVLVDPDQVRIVLGNLLRNAYEAMPDGGAVTVTAVAVSDGGAVEVAVADEGVGIPPEQQARVMEPLYSTKARGLGLGLAIAKAVLEKNQGRLGLESTPGRGTTFTVRLTAAPHAEGVVP
jgi:signal transduction histidine kinase